MRRTYHRASYWDERLKMAAWLDGPLPDPVVAVADKVPLNEVCAAKERRGFIKWLRPKRFGPLIATMSSNQPWNGLEEHPCVGILRRSEDVLCRAFFHDLAAVHHDDAITKMTHDREVVADEQQCEAEFLA